MTSSATPIIHSLRQRNAELSNDNDTFPSTCVLDIRPREVFNTCHIKGSTWFMLEKGLRFAELPPASATFRILAVVALNADTLELFLEELSKSGYTQPENTLVVATIEDLMNAFSSDCELLEHHSDTSRILWRPNPTIPIFIRHLCQEERVSPQTAIIFDLGCGIGRDAVALILGLQPVTTIVHCIDLPNMLIRCQRFAARHGVTVVPHAIDLDPHACNQSETDPLRQLLRDAQQQHDTIIAIVMSRFMHRAALRSISQFAPPQTYVLIHHFIEGAISRTGKEFKGGDDAILHIGELETDFFGPQQEFECIPLMNEQHMLHDARPMVSFITRKR